MKLSLQARAYVFPCLASRLEKKERKLNAGNGRTVSEFKISSFQNTSAVALFPLVKMPFTLDLVDTP
jgi:hypothetical protein